MSIIDGPIPRHTYETVDGTEPVASGQHEPRTLKHTVTIGDQSDLVSMMTEIGDGTFVAWTECRKCRKHITACPCPDGPTEPEYMTAWKEKRFVRTLNERPDPSYALIPSIVSWLEERGYTVTKNPEEAPEPEENDERPRLKRPSTAFEERPPGSVYEVPEDAGLDLAEQVDDGLDKATEAVKQARNLDDIDVDF